MSQLPPDISAIVAKDKDGATLTDEEVEKLRAWHSSTPARPDYADSLKAAASMLGVSVTTLQAAKNAGCGGFRGSRVMLDEVEKFLEETDLASAQGLSEKDSLELAKKREELRKIRFANEVAEGRYINIDEHAATLRRIGSQTRQILRVALERRWPEIAAMKSQRDLRQIGGRLFDEICEEMQKTFGADDPVEQ